MVLKEQMRCSRTPVSFALELQSLNCSMDFWSRGVWLAPPDSGTEFGSGAMPNTPYVVWTRHGERGVVIEENKEEENDNNIPDWAAGQAFADTLMEDTDEEEISEDGHVDDLGQVLKDAQRDYENDNEKAKLQHMIQYYRKLLYPDCKQSHKKLGTALEMLQ
jgi:hypothetical protein